MKKNRLREMMSGLILAVLLGTVSCFGKPVEGGWSTVVSSLSYSDGAVQAGWHGWWFRGPTEWIQFDFTGVPPSKLNVDLYLGVTNHLDGEQGLDGLVDVVISSPTKDPLTFADVLLNNVDPNNQVFKMNVGGSYNAYARLAPAIASGYVVDGQLSVRVLRHTDSYTAPSPPPPDYAPITGTWPDWVIPSGVYESDDAHRVHLFVWCNDGDGGTVVDNGGWGYVELSEVPAPVGGYFVASDTLALLAPYIALSSVIIVGCAGIGICLKRLKRKQ
jgi:hypothetical protein